MIKIEMLTVFFQILLMHGSKLQNIKFYLGSLHISQKPIFNIHKNEDVETNVPKSNGRGNNIKNKNICSRNKKYGLGSY